MNPEIILSGLRQLLMFGGGVLVARGYLSAEELVTIVGALVALGGSAWAFYSRRSAGIIASAAALPDVSTVITTTEAAAQNILAANVVGPSRR